MTDKALTIYSGRLRPDLTPIYKLFEGLTGIKASVEMIYHLDVEQRIKAERADPQGDRLLANGLRIYPSNKHTRDALIPEGNAVAMVNSSNFHVFLMEGNPVGEAWLDQERGGIGTNIEAHVVAVIKGAKHPQAARDFIDWLLSPDIQTLLARMFGETPVNAKAVHGMVKPLSDIRRTDVSLAKITALRDSTRAYLSTKGFAAPERD